MSRRKEELLNVVKEGNYQRFLQILEKGDVSVFGVYKGNPLWVRLIHIAQGKILESLVELLAKKSPKRYKGNWIEVALVLKRGDALSILIKKFRNLLLEERLFFKRGEREIKERLLNILLLELTRSGRKEEVKLLLRKFPREINPNVQDEVGNTPLHYAAYRGDEELVAALLKSGGDVSIPNEIGLTPEGIINFKKLKVGA